jgi:peptidyl-prolyl cis-trans isomerase B (cyclophilin B)
MKKWMSLCLCGVLTLSVLTGCNKIYREIDDGEEISKNVSNSSPESTQENVPENEKAQAFLKENFPSNGSAELLNFRQVQDGEEVAVLKTSMGTIKIMLFPEAAPKAVENFKALIQDGYYNGVTFHRVISDFMIQGGDPTGTGSGGESSFGKSFEDEFSEKALNFRGALSMANTGKADTNGSQFFIVQAPANTLSSTIWDQLEMKQNAAFPDSVKEKYKEVGGTPWLDFHHTVFGQVYEGMDVVDAISAVETNSSGKPVEDVVIESATLEKASVKE